MAIYKLEDIAIIKNGTTPSTKNKNLWLKEIPFFGPSDLNNMKPKRYITKNINNLKRPGTTLISSTATIGNIGFLKIESWFNQQITSIEPNNNFLLDKYLYYYFLKNSKKIKNMKDGGSIFTILKISVFKNWKFFLPSLKTQKQIIDIIEPFEKIIDKNNLIIKNISKYIIFLNKNRDGNFKNQITFQTSKGKILKDLNGENRYFNNSKNISFCNKINNNGEALIVTTRGTLTTHIAFDYWYSTNNIYILKGKGIFSNKKNIENMIKTNKRGSTIPMISKLDIINSLKSYDVNTEKQLRNLFIAINRIIKLNNKLKNTKKKLIKLLLN